LEVIGVTESLQNIADKGVVRKIFRIKELGRYGFGCHLLESMTYEKRVIAGDGANRKILKDCDLIAKYRKGTGCILGRLSESVGTESLGDNSIVAGWSSLLLASRAFLVGAAGSLKRRGR
jgi:hypothetical protein